MCSPMPMRSCRKPASVRASANEAAAAAACRLDQLSAAWGGDIQVHRRHQRRLRRSPTSHRAGSPAAPSSSSGGLRRLLHHAGAQPRLRDEIADLAL
jgi:hypothetical protein